MEPGWHSAKPWAVLISFDVDVASVAVRPHDGFLPSEDMDSDLCFFLVTMGVT